MYASPDIDESRRNCTYLPTLHIYVQGKTWFTWLNYESSYAFTTATIHHTDYSVEDRFFFKTRLNVNIDVNSKRAELWLNVLKCACVTAFNECSAMRWKLPCGQASKHPLSIPSRCTENWWNEETVTITSHAVECLVQFDNIWNKMSQLW